MIVVLDRTGRLTPPKSSPSSHPAGLPAVDDGRLFVVEDVDIALALSAASLLSIPYSTTGASPPANRQSPDHGRGRCRCDDEP